MQVGVIVSDSDWSKALNGVDAVVHFDLPPSLRRFALRQACYNRLGRDKPCKVYLFRDDTRALPPEEQLLTVIQGLGPGPQSFDVDTGDPFDEMFR